MSKELTQDEIYVRAELTKLYPQLLINCKKTLGAAYDKHGGDLMSTCVEFFLNKPIEIQVESFKSGKAENFLTFMMGMQSKSGTSRFYTMHRKFHESQRELYVNFDYDYLKKSGISDPFDDEDDDLMLCIKAVQDKLDPYEKMLLTERVIQKESFVNISEKYDIPYSSLAGQLKKVLKKIQIQCQHLR